MSIKKETSVLELVINGKQAETSINGLTSSIKAAEREFRKMREADDPIKYRQAANAIGAQKNALNEMRTATAGANNQAKGFHATWQDIAKGMVAGFGIQQGIGMIISFGKQVFETTAKFQKLEAVLTTTLGSKSQAKLAMQQIQEFAASTPFQVDELTDSYVKLANQGFKPTLTQMRSLGDLAASTGKTFDQLTEGIIDAQVGEFERMKEFGVRAKKEGDNVSFTFKGVTTTVKGTEDAVREYITSLGDLEGVSGSMAGISETLSGKVSNLGDSWDQLLVTVGNETSGVFSGAISIMGEAINTITDYLKKLNIAQKYNTEGGGFWAGVGEIGNKIMGGKINMAEMQREIFAGISDSVDKQIGEAKYFRELITIQDDLTARMKRVDRGTQDGAAAWNLYNDKLVMVKDAWAGLKKERVDEVVKKQTAAQKEAATEAAKAAKEAAKQAERDRKQRQKDIENLKETLQKELLALDISKMDELDQIVANITSKYDPLIAKAKELNQLDLAASFTALKDSTVDKASSEFIKKDAEKQKKTDFADAEKQITESFGSQKLGINSNEALTPEEMAVQEYDLETERLLALQTLYRAFDESSLEYDQALADRRVAIRDKEFQDKKLLAQAEVEIQQATMDTAAMGVDALKGMVDQQGALYKGLIIAEKAIAIASVIINTQKEIAGYYAAYSALGPPGFATATTFAGIAKVRAGISIATIAATGVKELTSADKKSSNKKASGGFIPDGPAHSAGGMTVLDANGRPVAEIEGGEPILSRETYRNNRQTIDELLYSSQRLNGAKVNFAATQAIAAERYFRSGGIISPPDWKQNVSNNNSAPVDMSNTNQLLKMLIEKTQNQQVVLSMKTFEEEQARRIKTVNDASA